MGVYIPQCKSQNMFYNFLVSTLGKLLVFLVNYTHYTAILYYEKVR
jgi:hypothetical protein